MAPVLNAATLRLPPIPPHLPRWLQWIVDLADRGDEIGFDYGKHHVSLLQVAVMILAIAGIYCAGQIANFIVRYIFKRLHGLDAAQRLLGEKLASIACWMLVVMIGADAVGLNLTTFKVFSGAVGLAVGFGLQKTFGNLIAGIILLMDRSIKPGDVIAVNDGKGSVGQIERIGLRAVSVVTRDKREFLIPNENLMTSQVENWSYSSREVAIAIPLGVAYNSDLEQVEALLIDAALSCPRVLRSPAPGMVLTAFGDKAIELTLGCWIDDPEEGYVNVRSDVLKAVWRRLRDAGIGLPGGSKSEITVHPGAELDQLIGSLAPSRKVEASGGQG